MLKRLKELMTNRTSNKPQPLSGHSDDKAVGMVTLSVNLDELEESAKDEFRQTAVKESGLSLFKGKVEHGYSLDRVANAEHCPRCHAPTQLHYANFIYATDEGARVLLTPAGFFCSGCPAVIVDERMIRVGVTRGFQYRGVVGIDHEGRKPPDFLKTWNGQRTVFILDEDENLVGITTTGGGAARPQASPIRQSEKAKKKRQMARQSRKRSRRKR